jgi:hypothetical protein
MRKPLYIVFFIILVFSAFYGGFVYKAKMSGQSVDLKSFINNVTNSEDKNLENKNLSEETKEQIQNTTNNTINVKWVDPVILPNDYSVLSDFWRTQPAEVTDNFKKENLKYKVGTVLDGIYKDKNVFLIGAPTDGPGPIAYYHYMIENNDKYILPFDGNQYDWSDKDDDKKVTDNFMLNDKKVLLDRNIIIGGLEVPEIMKQQINGKYWLFDHVKRTILSDENFFKNLKYVKKVFTNEKLDDVYIIDPSKKLLLKITMLWLS